MSLGVNVTESVWPLPGSRTVPAGGLYTNVPATLAEALSWPAPSALPNEMAAGLAHAMAGAVVARLVSEKLTGVSPAALAITLYGPPAWVFALKTVAVSTPLEFVVACVVFVPLANVPLTPVDGAVKVTATPCTGLLSMSSTVTLNSVPNAVDTRADWGAVFPDICDA